METKLDERTGSNVVAEADRVAASKARRELRPLWGILAIVVLCIAYLLVRGSQIAVNVMFTTLAVVAAIGYAKGVWQALRKTK